MNSDFTYKLGKQALFVLQNNLLSCCMRLYQNSIRAKLKGKSIVHYAVEV